MIDRIDEDVFDVFCDGDHCYEKFTVFGSFDDVLKELKQRDWLTRKERYDWAHYCSDCHRR